MKQNRFKSVVLWSSLVSALIAFLVGSEIISLGLGKTVSDIVAFVFTTLAGFGILNNPTNPKGF